MLSWYRWLAAGSLRYKRQPLTNFRICIQACFARMHYYIQLARSGKIKLFKSNVNPDRVRITQDSLMTFVYFFSDSYAAPLSQGWTVSCLVVTMDVTMDTPNPPLLLLFWFCLFVCCFVFAMFFNDHFYVRSFPTCSTKMIKLPFDLLETRLRPS